MALIFDGFTQSIELGGSRPYARNVAAATIMCWARRDGAVAVNTQQPMLQFGAGNVAVNTRFRIEIQNGNPSLAIRARSLDGDSSSQVLSPNVYTPGIWRHIAAVVTFTARLGVLYVNGVEDTRGTFASMTAGNTSNTNALASSIGGVAGAAVFIAGDLADARIYTRALGKDEILTIASSYGRDGIVSGLQGRWMLNEQAINVPATNVPDLSANGFGGLAASSIAGITSLYGDDFLEPRRKSRRRS